MPKKKAYEMPPPIPAGEKLRDTGGTEWSLGKSVGKGGFGEIYLASKGKTEDYVVKIVSMSCCSNRSTFVLIFADWDAPYSG